MHADQFPDTLSSCIFRTTYWVYSMIRTIVFQNNVPIEHPYCDAQGIMKLNILPRVGEDIMLDGTTNKITNIIHILGAADYDVRIDIATDNITR